MKVLQFLLFFGLMVFAYQVPAQSIYVTKTGEKYHKGSCHFLKNSKKEISFEKAQQLGFTACSVCKPTSLKTKSSSATAVNSFYSAPKSSAQKSSSTQCTGKTKAGTRCQRMTKASNGRCHQH